MKLKKINDALTLDRNLKQIEFKSGPGGEKKKHKPDSVQKEYVEKETGSSTENLSSADSKLEKYI